MLKVKGEESRALNLTRNNHRRLLLIIRYTDGPESQENSEIVLALQQRTLLASPGCTFLVWNGWNSFWEG